MPYWGDVSDVIMGAMASQITILTVVYPTFYSGADQRKHQSSASLAFVRGIHRSPVNSPHKGPVTRKMFPLDDVIMVSMTTPLLDVGHHKVKNTVWYRNEKAGPQLWVFAALCECVKTTSIYTYMFNWKYLIKVKLMEWVYYTISNDVKIRTHHLSREWLTYSQWVSYNSGITDRKSFRCI